MHTASSCRWVDRRVITLQFEVGCETNLATTVLIVTGIMKAIRIICKFSFLAIPHFWLIKTQPRLILSLWHSTYTSSSITKQPWSVGSITVPFPSMLYVFAYTTEWEVTSGKNMYKSWFLQVVTHLKSFCLHQISVPKLTFTCDFKDKFEIVFCAVSVHNTVSHLG